VYCLVEVVFDVTVDNISLLLQTSSGVCLTRDELVLPPAPEL